MDEELLKSIISSKNWEAIKELALVDSTFVGRMKALAAKRVDRYSLGEIILTTNDYTTEKSRTMDSYFKEGIRQKQELDDYWKKFDEMAQADPIYIPLRDRMERIYIAFLAGSIEATHISGVSAAAYVKISNALIESYDSPQFSQSDLEKLEEAGKNLSEAGKVINGLVAIAKASKKEAKA